MTAQEKATPAEIFEQLVRIHTDSFSPACAMVGRAFFNYNLMAYAAADDHDRAVGVTTLYGALLWDCLSHGEVYVAPGLAGAACWIPPGVAASSLWRQIAGGMLRLPLQFGWRGFRRLIAYDAVAQKLHHQNAAGPHWYLSVLAVEPARQGQGIGSALMRPMLRRADEQGLPCYLDTHEDRNVRLYQKHGFEVASRVEPSGHPITVYSMVRKPRAIAPP